jgi:hypothetical protein
MAKLSNNTVIGFELIVLDERGRPMANPALRAIPVFKEIFVRVRRDSDNRTMHDTAKVTLNEFSYIYYMVDIRSFAVQAHPSDTQDLERHHKVVKALKLPEKWMPDKVIEDAADWYKSFHYTAIVKMLKTGFIAVNVTIDYLEKVDYTIRDGKGKLIYTPKEVMDMLDGLKRQKSVLESLMQEVIRDLNLGGRPKGGGSIGIFENPDKERLDSYDRVPTNL